MQPLRGQVTELEASEQFDGLKEALKECFGIDVAGAGGNIDEDVTVAMEVEPSIPDPGKFAGAAAAPATALETQSVEAAVVEPNGTGAGGKPPLPAEPVA